MLRLHKRGNHCLENLIGCNSRTQKENGTRKNRGLFPVGENNVNRILGTAKYLYMYIGEAIKRPVWLIVIQWVKLKPSTDPLESTWKSSLLTIFHLFHKDRSGTLSPARCLALPTTSLIPSHSIVIKREPRSTSSPDLCDQGAGTTLWGR